MLCFFFVFFCKTYTIITYQIVLFRVKFLYESNFFYTCRCDNHIVNFDFDEVIVILSTLNIYTLCYYFNDK